ncbi:MAG: aminopeptidase [Treponema sp.]|uniref:aminopeptidase n=1 Tax=Treponema sp. TaxID=166 RepID=UPI003FA219AE
MELAYKAKTAWETLTAEELAEMQTFSQDYIAFLNHGKTERECTAQIIEHAKAAGFKPLEDIIKSGTAPAGTKVYLNNKDKSVVMMVLGKDITEGMHIVGAHIDSPRLDLKQMPLYEDSNLAFLKTHYYGGIKKYQWTTIPLAIHGVIFTKEGKKVEVCIGEDENDPVLFINDLLIHLSKKQLQETLAEGITAEQLNVLVGNMKPAAPEEKKDGDDAKKESSNPVKENILKILNTKYGIVEEDFRIAELEVVPAGKARHVGLDNSMVAGHGHDDRVCAYTTLRAILDVTGVPEKTAVALFADKEEIGSVGNTGMTALYFENMVAELAALQKAPCDIGVRRAFAHSCMLSADVSAGYDPAFPSVFEKLNAAYIGSGICINKYTGSGGKSGSNDANAEYLQEIRHLFDSNKVVWQTAELGLTDAGGGGTIAYILAKYGTEVVDCGVPVLSMHAPIELVSKADILMAYRAYRAFLNR